MPGPQSTHDHAVHYEEGRVYALCDRCGTKWAHASLRNEWTGLLVCPTCWDPKPPQLTPPEIDPMEGVPAPNPRPRPPDVYVVSTGYWETLDGFARWTTIEGTDWTGTF